MKLYKKLICILSLGAAVFMYDSAAAYLLNAQKPNLQNESIVQFSVAPYKDLVMLPFKDNVYGYSFIYPANDGRLQPSDAERGVNASHYDVSVKELNMHIRYAAYFGGYQDFDREFFSAYTAPDVQELVATQKGDDWFTLKYKNGYGMMTVGKYYFGRKMHQCIVIKYPERYDDDEDYQNLIVNLINAFKPTV